MYKQNKRSKRSIWAIIIIFIFSGQWVNGQQVTDTLTLDQVIAQVIAHNPIVAQSSEGIKTAEFKTKLAESAWLPLLDLNSSYQRIGPIPAFDIPNIGHIQMYPNNGANFSVEARQMIYDFGKTSKNVELQKAGEELATLSSEQLKEKFAMASAGIFYNLIYYQYAKAIVEDHLKTLKQHLQFVENKSKTGSATQYEILSTQVTVSAAEIKLSELNTTYGVQLSHLGAIMDTTLNKVFFYSDTTVADISSLDSSIYENAFTNRYDMQIVKKKNLLNELNYQLIKTENYPTLGFMGSAGWKNGYLPEIEKLKLNYFIGVSLYFPFFDANRKKIKLNIAGSSINQAKLEQKNTELLSEDEITAAYLQLVLSANKIKQADLQMQQAKEAYHLAEINYQEGVITNLDLIYASDMLTNSRLQLLQNKIEYRFALLKYKDAQGEVLY